MNKALARCVVYVVLAALTWFGYLAWRASKNLVTLDVRDMPLRDVVRKIEWQTWELIITHKDVDGKVTMNVKNQPLEAVLGIVADQLGCRWSAEYPLYSKSASLERFKKSIRGELEPKDYGWTNLASRGFGFRGMFGENLRAENDVLTVNLQNKDLLIATMALARYAQARITPEDGTAGTVSVTVKEGTMDDAVKQLAQQTGRKWTHYYSLLGGFGSFRPRPEMTRADTNAPALDPTNAPPRPFEEPSPEVAEARRKQFEAQLETMTPEERAKAVAERERMEKMRAEMANLTPEERRQRFEQMMNSPEGQERRSRMQTEMESRMVRGLKNTTPEQRVDRDKFFQQMRQGGGPGGFRPPPR